jgi:hypothetical protein
MRTGGIQLDCNPDHSSSDVEPRFFVVRALAQANASVQSYIFRRPQPQNAGPPPFDANFAKVLTFMG